MDETEKIEYLERRNKELEALNNNLTRTVENLEKAAGMLSDSDEQKNTDLKYKFLSEASNILISSIDYEKTLKNIAGMAVPYFADWCAVDMLDESKKNIKRLAVEH